MIHGLDTGFLVAAEVREHAGARVTLTQVLSAGDVIAIAPRVLAEFIHVVTDPRRFTQPLDMNAARHVAEQRKSGVSGNPVSKSGVSSSFLSEKMNRHRITRLGLRAARVDNRQRQRPGRQRQQQLRVARGQRQRQRPDRHRLGHGVHRGHRQENLESRQWLDPNLTTPDRAGSRFLQGARPAPCGDHLIVEGNCNGNGDGDAARS